MPEPLDRPRPLTEQIHDILAAGITAGLYRNGDQLPSVTELADRYGVSRTTAANALQWLVTDGIAQLLSRRRGYVARPGRTVLSPPQRRAVAMLPAAERIDVLSATLADAPRYVRPLLALEPVRMDGLTPVIRREQVHYDHLGVPYMLVVEWYPPQLADQVPELLQAEPIPDAVALIEQRTGRIVVRGRQAREARPIKDDGREGPHLRLLPGSHVLAEVWMWSDLDRALVYGEYVLLEGRVTQNEWAA
jgi:GntR family transcriptional regulator